MYDTKRTDHECDRFHFGGKRCKQIPLSKKRSDRKSDRILFLAEKEGFEPSIPFWGIHDFQSCALGQLRDFSMSAQASLSILHHPSSFVKSKLFFFQHFLEAPENGGFQKIILQTGFRKARCKSLFDSTIPHVFPAPQYDRPASQESHPLHE